MRLSDLNIPEVEEALAQAGVSEDRIEEIANDFLTDTYWNDPKCAGRRVRAEGGDHVRFFDALDGIVQWD